MKIFISYRSLDRETIRTLVHQLEDIGHEVWSDLKISGGQDWWNRVLAGIRDCDLFLFGLTSNWFASDACLREFDYATTLGKNRLPVRLNDIDLGNIPVQVRRLQIVTYDTTDPASFRNLQRAINRMPVPPPLPDPLPQPPTSPVGDLDEYDQQLRQLRLERDAQAAMVFELKRALRRRQSADQARQLLQTLRKHPDTVDSVADRIDQALSQSKADKRDTLPMDVLAPLPDNPAKPTRAPITRQSARHLGAIQTFAQHTETVYAVAFSPDATLLASASGDKTIRLYSLLDNALLATLRGHGAAVRDVVFSPDNQRIASASADGTVRLWGIRENRAIDLLEPGQDWMLRVGFAPQGEVLAASSVSEMTTLWDVNTLSVLGTLGGHADWVSGLAFSPDGTTLATAAYDGTIRFWSVARRRRMHAIASAGGMIEDIAFTGAGTGLAAAMQDGLIRLWSVAKQEEVGALRGHQHSVHSVAFSPNEQLLASAGADGTLRLWDMRALEECACYQAHDGAVWQAAFSADSSLIATAGDDGLVKVWALG